MYVKRKYIYIKKELRGKYNNISGIFSEFQC